MVKECLLIIKDEYLVSSHFREGALKINVFTKKKTYFVVAFEGQIRRCEVLKSNGGCPVSKSGCKARIRTTIFLNDSTFKHMTKHSY